VGYVCAGYRLGENALQVPRRERVPAKARALIGWLTVQTKAATLTEVAQRFDSEPWGLSR